MKNHPKGGRNAVLVLATAAFIFLVYFAIQDSSKNEQFSGEIFLYGEEHSVEAILEEELALWSSHYHNDGMRHLFVELPYYTAEYMNVWMNSDEDTILDALYQDWAGTAMYSQEVLHFYKQIKLDCPETVFHGTDVGHQYDTTGNRFLEYLVSTGQQQSELYRLSTEAIRQGQYYYQHFNDTYRENTMTENFIREFEGLQGDDVMGIYGAAHTNIKAMEYTTGSVPCMANQLYKKYRSALHTEDLTALAAQPQGRSD